MNSTHIKQIFKLGITLSAYCIVAAFALSITYSVTLPKIQEQKKIAIEKRRFYVG